MAREENLTINIELTFLSGGVHPSQLVIEVETRLRLQLGSPPDKWVGLELVADSEIRRQSSSTSCWSPQIRRLIRGKLKKGDGYWDRMLTSGVGDIDGATSANPQSVQDSTMTCKPPVATHDGHVPR